MSHRHPGCHIDTFLHRVLSNSLYLFSRINGIPFIAIHAGREHEPRLCLSMHPVWVYWFSPSLLEPPPYSNLCFLLPGWWPWPVNWSWIHSQTITSTFVFLLFAGDSHPTLLYHFNVLNGNGVTVCSRLPVGHLSLRRCCEPQFQSVLVLLFLWNSLPSAVPPYPSPALLSWLIHPFCVQLSPLLPGVTSLSWAGAVLLAHSACVCSQAVQPPQIASFLVWTDALVLLGSSAPAASAASSPFSFSSSWLITACF